jgi:hypothetical protein
MKQKRQKLFNTLCVIGACAFISTLVLLTGCSPGIITVLSTPTSAETKIDPEYNLAAEKDKKILILVDQPSSLNCHPNLRYFLTDSAIKTFEMKAKLPEEVFITYDALAEFRSNTTDFSLMTPGQIGSSLGADFVLLIVVNNCKLIPIGDTGFINGTLDAQGQLFKVQGDVKVWPTAEQAKTVRVGFESEKRGPDAAALRLAVAGAHCITRYLYNCPKPLFKISDETKDVGWEKF